MKHKGRHSCAVLHFLQIKCSLQGSNSLTNSCMTDTAEHLILPYVSALTKSWLRCELRGLFRGTDDVRVTSTLTA